MSPTEFDSHLRGSSSSPTPLGASEYAFADISNLEHCAKYLNQTLVTFGFPASLDLFANDPVSVARTCNCMYALLQQRQRDIEFRESANEQRQRLMSDISRLEAKVERLEAQLAGKDRDIATMTRTEAKATAAFKSQIDKLQQERDEFQKMVLGNQKEGRSRGTWNGKKADNEFYKKIVDAYEAKNQELAAENADLRALLRSMQVDMREFLNAPDGKQSCLVNERPDTDPSQSPLGGRTDMFDLPLHMARDQIEESLRTKMTSIKERMFQLQDAHKVADLTSDVTERELELEAQLVEARSIIQEQVSLNVIHDTRYTSHIFRLFDPAFTTQHDVLWCMSMLPLDYPFGHLQELMGTHLL
ncbi:Afadin- and alpha-actinin-binding protein [Dorcoceras hygrometricum]|uniref:Afadin-and alpha-actinin-binding protein n=1 Tax=Dorcoceras hygrometricum TaxID=472368 RepID=A0A2Z7A6A6_9LAMI|nr:Afadin- and alpha-actinin-binding protein [Dorcoceras hygrometricum]